MYETLSLKFFQLLQKEVRNYDEMREMEKSIERSNRTKRQVFQERYAEAPKRKQYHRMQNK